ncbi:hypothetical protein [Novosphingobium aquae]|uniref:Transposase n=1 Tax=Novosphingobium aquae TaxID=3133435 RepID=A0ABU8S9K0_9SPHN
MPEAVRTELLTRFSFATADRITDRRLARQIVENTRLVTGRQLRELCTDAEFRR